MGTGHILDSDTHILWRFDETDEAATSIADASGNGRTLDNVVKGGHPIVPGVAGNARIIHIDNYWDGPVDTTADAALFAGDYTVEGWVFLTRAVLASDPNGSGTVIMGLRNQAATNSFQIRIQSSMNLLLFNWQTSSVNWFLSSSANVLVPSEWQHIAIRVKNIEGDPSNETIEFFVNGVRVTGPMIKPKYVLGNVSDLRWTFGSNTLAFGNQGGPNFPIALDDWRISKVARTDNEILTTYQAGMPSAWLLGNRNAFNVGFN